MNITPINHDLPCLTALAQANFELTSGTGRLVSIPILPSIEETPDAASFSKELASFTIEGVHSTGAMLDSMGSPHLGSVAEEHWKHLMESPAKMPTISILARLVFVTRLHNCYALFVCAPYPNHLRLSE